MVRRLRPFALALAALVAAGAATAAPAPKPAAPGLRELEAAESNREHDLAADEAAAQAAKTAVDQFQAELDALNAAEANGERSVSEKQLELAGLNAQQRDLDAALGGE